MTSHHISSLPTAHQARPPLRLLLSTSLAEGALDGGWWPHSRDIDVELADLVDQFPAVTGRVGRALYSRPDWDTQPHTVRVARGRLKTGSFPRDDTHMVALSMSTGTRLLLLVVPPDQALGEQAMALAADPSNRSSATEILDGIGFDGAATEHHWTDDGGSWWRPEDGPPSLRPGPSH